MFLWVVPGCPSTRRLFCRHWDLVTLLLILLVASGTLIKSSRSQVNSHHYTTHTVSTKYGALRGVRLQFSSSATRHLDPVNAYLGIPYASPPVNAYRFMPPVAPLPWGGTRLAVTYPPACPQRFPDISNRTKALQSMTVQRYQLIQKLIPQLANQSEDCLYLNVFQPVSLSNLGGEEIRPGKYAIIFVIHGESWNWGSGSEFDGAALASLGQNVVVTINYRLGVLGFLKTSNQQSNFGLLDVIAALHWVRENGESFGGDRNRITILGYRTGAVIANLLLVAQIAKGLFQRAILISGSVLSPWALQRRPEDIASQVAAQLGCEGKLPLSHPLSDLAPCLRRKHLTDLLNVVPDNPRFLSGPFAPFVDGILIRNPKPMMETDMSDQFLRSQVLILFTTSEGVHELSSAELKNGFESDHRDRILRTLVRNVFTFHQQEIFSIVRNEYTDWERPILHPIPMKDATVEALSDCLVVGPALQVALIHSRRKGKTFVLHFSHVHTSKLDSDHSPYKRLGSLEGDIVPYVMGLPVTNNVPALGGQLYVSPWSVLANFSKQDAVVSETLVHYTSNFAKSGDPNVNEPPMMLSLAGNQDVAIIGSGSGLGGNSRERLRLRSLHWDPYEPGSQTYMELGTKPKIRSHYRSHKMALFLNLIPQIHLPGGSDVSLAHHAFQDDNPNLYVGSVRPLLPYTIGDPIPGFGLAPGVGIVVSGSGSHNNGSGGQQQTQSPGLTTTECLESTEPPLTQGTRHSVRIDSNEVEVEIHGGGGEPGAPLSSSGMGLTNGEYDYTTALTVTLTVGVCLILLNLVVFSAIMCHRKRGFNIPVNLVDNGSRRSSHSGTPQKSTYQDEYKWTPCCSSSMNPGEFHQTSMYSGGGPESIQMNQFPVGIPPSREHAQMSSANSGSQATSSATAECNSPSGTLIRSSGSSSPPPLMGLSSPSTLQRNPHHPHRQHHHPSCHTLQPSSIPPPPQHQQQYQNMNSGSGTLKKSQQQQQLQSSQQMHHHHHQPYPLPHHLQQQQQQQPQQLPSPHQMPMAIPDFIQTTTFPNIQGCIDSDPNEFQDLDPSIPESAIRLYMNQVAGENLLDSGLGKRSSCTSSTSPGSCINPSGTASSTSSSTCTTATNTNSNSTNNPNPSGGGTNPSPGSGSNANNASSSLVGVLKRHSTGGTTTPNSTVKKRVQIQEISV